VITNDMHYFVWHTSVREYRRSGGMVLSFHWKTRYTPLCCVMCRCLDVSFPPLPKAENDAYISSHVLLPVTCFIKLRAFIISFSSLVRERRVIEQEISLLLCTYFDHRFMHICNDQYNYAHIITWVILHLRNNFAI
jgi:hypothetical protein